MEDTKTLVLVFSFNRALQLDSTVRSFLLHCKDVEDADIRVLYRTSSALHADHYLRLRDEFSVYGFIRFFEEGDFRSDVLALIATSEKVLFLVDDNIFVEDFSLRDAVEALDREQIALGFSLRLGRNTTYCYPLDAKQELPAFTSVGNGMLLFDWRGAEHDFGYPLEVSSSLYRTDDLFPLLAELPFNNPNTLEGGIAARKSFYAQVRPSLLCLERSVTFCAPINKVQTIFMNNRSSADIDQSPDNLAKVFAQGARVMIEKYHGFRPNACHQEVELFLSQSARPMDSQPLVSVVIPCYNYGRFLSEAVESILSQSYTELEIIIVNDGSTDNTTDVAQRLIAANPLRRIRMLNQANSGHPAISRNRGIAEARGEYILPLDADDKIDPTMVKKMVAVLEGNNDVHIVYCDTMRFGDVNNAYQTGEWNLHRLAMVNTMNYCALFRRKVWEDVGGYRADCGYEDWDFWISAAEKGFRGYRIPEYLFHYRIKQTGRLALDKRNDEKNRALIASHHPDLYDEATMSWAKGVLAAENVTGAARRILLVAHNFPPHWYAGVEIYTCQLATALMGIGIDVSVMYPLHRDGLLQPELEESSFNGLRVFRLLSDHSIPVHGGLPAQVANPEQERVFAEFLRQQNFHVIHFHHTLGMPFSFIKIAGQMGYHVCVTLHDSWFLCVSIHLLDATSGTLCKGPESPDHCVECYLTKTGQVPSAQDRFALEQWVRFRGKHVPEILNGADCIASPTRYLADLFHRYGITRTIEIAPLGLKGVRTSGRRVGSPLVFAFLGNIHDLKNVYLLAESFKGVTGDARLEYHGGGVAPYLARLKKAIEEDDRISYCGRYQPEHLAEILDGVDLVVIPSVTENYPLVVREALSARVPVLASRVGGIPEIVTHLRDGILFDPAEPGELREWLQTLVDRPSMVRELKRNIRPVKSMEQDAREWAARYAHLAGGHSSATAASTATRENIPSPLSVAVYSLDHPGEACGRLRLTAPFEALGGAIECHWGVVTNGASCTTNLDMIDQADIIVIQRFYPRKGTVPYIEKMLSSGKPVIYEVDDLLFDLPDDNHLKFWAGETLDLFPWLLPRVTAITVSTPLLAKEFSVFNPSVHVIPNLADTELFQPVATKKNGPVVIGFSGTVTHARDLKRIGEALFRVADRYGDKVAFSFMGLSASEYSSLQGFRFLDFEREYASYGKALSASGIDIAIVPLQDNKFNRCKSNIKWLEYSSCGIAGIYADLPPYNTSVEHGASGVLVDDAPDKWFQAICLLVDHPELRNRIAQHAKKEVLSKHSLKGGAKALHNLYESIANNNCSTIIA